MPPGRRDTNTVHVFCDNLFDVAERISDFETNFGILVSMTIVPVNEKDFPS